MKKSDNGFSFLQLIIVLIIIVGIAVIAIPRFINQTSNARIAALNGLVDAINNASISAVTQYHLNTAPTNGDVVNINIGGKSITVINGTGFPTSNASGIGAILPSLSDYSVNYKDTVAIYNFTTPVADCMVIYNTTTGQATAVDSGC